MVHNPYPVRVPVILERFQTGGTDDLGNPAEGYTAPEDVLVVGVEPPTMSDPVVAGHERVAVDAKMYAPTSIGFSDKDRVTVNGARFEVIGWPAPADMGPWWDLPMCTVLLHMMEAR